VWPANCHTEGQHWSDAQKIEILWYRKLVSRALPKCAEIVLPRSSKRWRVLKIPKISTAIIIIAQNEPGYLTLNQWIRSGNTLPTCLPLSHPRRWAYERILSNLPGADWSRPRRSRCFTNNVTRCGSQWRTQSTTWLIFLVQGLHYHTCFVVEIHNWKSRRHTSRSAS